MYLNLLTNLRLIYFFRWKALVILTKKFFSKSLYSFELYGSRFFIRKDSSDFFVFSSIFLFREFRFPKSFTEPLTIVDLGANNGASAVFFANMFPSAKIIAVEPDPENFSILNKNTKEYSNIICVNAAIGNQSGYVRLKDEKSDDWAKQFVSADEGILLLTMNDLIQKFSLSVIDLLKIDIEGAEAQVFANDFGWINSTRSILIELHDSLDRNCSQNFYRSFCAKDFRQTVMGEKVLIQFSS